MQSPADDQRPRAGSPCRSRRPAASLHAHPAATGTADDASAGDKAAPPSPAPKDPHSGEGADSALKALQKKRVPAPKPPEGEGKA